MEIFVDFSKAFDMIAFAATVAATVIMLVGFVVMCRTAKGVGVFSVFYYILSWIIYIPSFLLSLANVVFLASPGGMKLIVSGGVGLIVGGEEIFFLSGAFFENIGRYLATVGGSYCMTVLVFVVFAISLLALIVTPKMWRRKKNAQAPAVVVYEGEKIGGEPRVDVAEVVKRSSVEGKEAGESESCEKSDEEKIEEDDSASELEPESVSNAHCGEAELAGDASDKLDERSEVETVGELPSAMAEISSVAKGGADEIFVAEEPEISDIEELADVSEDIGSNCEEDYVTETISEKSDEVCKEQSLDKSDEGLGAETLANEVFCGVASEDTCEPICDEEQQTQYKCDEKTVTTESKTDGYFAEVKIRTVRAPRKTSRKVTAAKRPDESSCAAEKQSESDSKKAVFEQKLSVIAEDAEPVTAIRELEPIAEAPKKNEATGSRRVRIKGGAAEQFARYLGDKTDEEKRKIKSSIGTIFIEKKK